jgi:hypothetical protein
LKAPRFSIEDRHMRLQDTREAALPCLNRWDGGINGPKSIVSRSSYLGGHPHDVNARTFRTGITSLIFVGLN